MIDLPSKRKRSLWKKIVLGIMPYHTLILIHNELRLLYVRLFSFLRKLNWEKTLKKFPQPYSVNIASGGYGKEGWLNLDCVKAKKVNGVFDLRKKIPLPDQTVEIIFCEHFLEHLDFYEEVPLFLHECYRVLIKGGVIRLIVPDAAAYMKAYFNEGGTEVMNHLRNTEKYATKMEVINRVFRQGGEHRFAYDIETLFVILKQAGFEPSVQSFNKSQKANLTLDRPERASESINVEGLKNRS